MKFVASIFAAVLTLGAIAEVEEVDGISWFYTIVNGEVIIGRDFNQSAIPKETIGKICVPTELAGVPVVCVGENAFRECVEVTSVVIPPGVKNIAGRAFYGCHGLVDVQISESVTNIDHAAFYGCSNLRTVSLPSTVESLGDYVFQSSGVESVVLSEKLTSLPNQAFYSCRSLRSITIPTAIKSIGVDAFFECNNLGEVKIFDLKSWCSIGFAGKNANPLSKAGKIYLNDKLITEVVLPCSIEIIMPYAFAGCRELMSVVVPDSVKSIGGGAFDGCTSLKRVKMPKEMLEIGVGAFCDCKSLTSIEIPAGVAEVGYKTFSNCSSLKWVSIPISVMRVDKTSFEGCSLETVAMPACYEGSIPVARHIVLQNGVTEVPARKFWQNDMEAITIPEGVTKVGECAFQYCHGISSLVIPSTVMEMKSGFECCTGLKSVTIKSGVRDIGEYAFYECTKLYSVELPSSVTNIGARAFSETAIKEMIIPSRVEKIGVGAFIGCASIESILIPPSVQSIGVAAFNGCREDMSVVVMCGDRSRVAELVSASGFDVTNIRWKECLLPPVILPDDKTTFQDATKVSVVSMIDGGVIHYTTDGSDPTIDSPVFKKFTATGKMTIKAITEYDGMISDIAVSRIGLGRCEQPRITSSLGRNFTKSGNVVSICCGTAGAEVHYTTDGETPTIESPLYTGPFEISETMMVRAAALNHPQYLDSEETQESFTREWIRVDTPSINAPSSFAGKAIKVTIGCSSEGVTIYYTTDGSDPMSNGLICTGEFEITETTAIRAVAIKNDYLPSYEAALTIVKNWTLAEAINVEGLLVSSEKPSDWLFDNQVAHDGRMSVRSGEVPDDEAADMRLSINGVGKLSFWWKASCEETDMPQICWWDYGTILIDGVEVAWIDGETDWERVEVEVLEGGEHQIVWRYSKDSDGRDGEDCLWIDEVSWTPKGVIGDLAQLSDVFGAGSEVVQCVKSDAELSVFNSFLSSCGVSQAAALSEAQKKWAYRSFKLSSIMVSPIMFEAEPELKIDTFRPAGSDWSICISLSAGGLAVEMAKDKLKERIRVGTSVEDICMQPNILAMPSADGTQLQFTIELPRGLQGFATVRID